MVFSHFRFLSNEIHGLVALPGKLEHTKDAFGFPKPIVTERYKDGQEWRERYFWRHVT
jgi:hypothetical protein